MSQGFSDVVLDLLIDGAVTGFTDLKLLLYILHYTYTTTLWQDLRGHTLLYSIPVYSTILAVWQFRIRGSRLYKCPRNQILSQEASLVRCTAARGAGFRACRVFVVPV